MGADDAKHAKLDKAFDAIVDGAIAKYVKTLNLPGISSLGFSMEGNVKDDQDKEKAITIKAAIKKDMKAAAMFLAENDPNFLKKNPHDMAEAIKKEMLDHQEKYKDGIDALNTINRSPAPGSLGRQDITGWKLKALTATVEAVAGKDKMKPFLGDNKTLDLRDDETRKKLVVIANTKGLEKVIETPEMQTLLNEARGVSTKSKKADNEQELMNGAQPNKPDRAGSAGGPKGGHLVTQHDSTANPPPVENPPALPVRSATSAPPAPVKTTPVPQPATGGRGKGGGH